MDFDPEDWEGDGLPDDAAALELFWDLGFLPVEVEALYEAAKREAWIREKTADHGEDPEWNITLARYFWRRAERFRRLVSLFDDYEGPEE